MTGDEARAVAERVARASYGRLLALLAAPTGDLQLAEDALADAFERALSGWPAGGVPNNPEAWLLTVARNRRRDVLKSAHHHRSVALEDEGARVMTTVMESVDPDAIPDERLALLFVCAHPAIDVRVRTPLMLQTVLGFDANRIGRAFAVPGPTMAQRLVRAKRRIRAARIPFTVPDRSVLQARLEPVLEAIYGVYSIEWQVLSSSSRASMADEAVYLAAVLAELLVDEPEAFGLAALLCLSLARAPARASPDALVPLEEQDETLWDRALIARGEAWLRRARSLGRIGRFQLEAAIQSAHCDRARSGVTDWAALRTLYDALVSVAPTLGARVARAATIGRLEGAEAGLGVLDAITDAGATRFQPAWATRAHLLAEAGRTDEARRAYAKAISLTTEAGVRAYLGDKLAALGE